jgi:hypothetical protein
MGDRHVEDIRGEVFQGGVGLGRGVAVDVPGDRPDLWGDGLQQSDFGPRLSPQGAVERREGFNRDKESGSGGEPRVTVCGEPPTWDNVMDMRVVWELPAPGMQAPGKTRKSRLDEPLVFGEPFEGLRRGGAQGLGGDAVL